jgi:hydrogenase maturation factor
MGEVLGIDPLGLIGSGSLLVCCRPDRSDRLLSELKQAAIMATDIGVVTEAGPGIDALEKETPVGWPHFDVDEITRLFG